VAIQRAQHSSVTGERWADRRTLGGGRKLLLILGFGLILTGCIATQNDEKPPAEADFDSLTSTADYREQIVPAISFATSNAPTNTSLSGKASFALPGGAAPLGAWVRLQVPNGIQVSAPNSGQWNCDSVAATQESGEFLCRVDAVASAEALSTRLPFTLVTSANPGFLGITVQAGYGDPSSTSLSWREAAGRSDAARSIIKVVSAMESPAPLLAKSARLELSQKPRHVVSLAVAPTRSAERELLIILPSVQPTDSFCLLYAAIGVSGGSSALVQSNSRILETLRRLAQRALILG